MRHLTPEVTTMELLRFGEPQVDEVRAVLARAFAADPLMKWIAPDPEAIRWIMEVGARYGVLFGEAYSTPGEVGGAAVWLKPGESDMTPERMSRAGMDEAPARLGEEGFNRFFTFLQEAEVLHKRDMSEPHWYLLILGVDPARQRRGLGGRLIAPMLERADRDRLPCYLETAMADNVRFYRRHGFDVAAETDLSGGGPHLWTMTRRPQ